MKNKKARDWEDLTLHERNEVRDIWGKENRLEDQIRILQDSLNDIRKRKNEIMYGEVK